MTFIRLSATGSRSARDTAGREKRWIVASLLLRLIVASATSCRAVRTSQTDQRYVQQLQPLLEQFV